MNKFITSAIIAATLAIGTPVVAQADSYRNSDRHYDHRGNDRHDSRRDHRRSDYRQAQRHEFSHWRPGLERQHYRSFGRPVYHDNYYRVRAYDHGGRVVFLNVNAYTGVILSIGR
ncbi:MAG: hypothetical protein ACOH12_09700 [Parvibaculaceae bacterium]